MSLADVRNWFVHLRLGFQLFLSPIFLWGFSSAGAPANRELVLGYIALHVFGYAGGTALNSFYDRDTGPIGGLEHPPPVPRGLGLFSIVWQAIGFVLALNVGPAFALVYMIMFWMSVAYSHPRVRFKGKPIAALVTVALGQGVLASMAGWICARGELVSMLSPIGLLCASAATLLTVGLYPLTEIYQIEEDRSRGDLTLAAWLGPSNCFRFAIVCLILGGASAIALIVIRYRFWEAAILALFLAGLILAIWRWWRTYTQAAIYGNFRTVMRLYAITSLGFAGWIGLHLVGVL